ncbi:MAG: sigma-70 family RNA polymerase sigma factor [Bacillota bacterium]
MDTITTKPSADAAEQALWERYWADPSVANRNALIERYYDLVRYHAHKVWKTLPRCSELNRDDLAQIGAIALFKLIDVYNRNYSPKTRFSTFASFRVRGAMLDALRGINPTERSTNRRIRVREQAVAELQMRLGRPPTDTEIRRHLHLSRDQWQKVREARPVAIQSLDFRVQWGDRSIPLSELVADPHPGPDHIDLVHDLIGWMLECQQFRLCDILAFRLKFIDGLRMQEIASALGGISESAVYQCIRELHQRLRIIHRLRPAEEN